MLITSCFPQELCQKLSLVPNYRGRQLFSALYQGCTQWDDVTVFPKILKAQLVLQGPLLSSQVLKIYPDGKNSKLVVALHDGQRVESVLLMDKNGRKTACLSCQVGCAMGCAFCQTGRLGLSRNLESGEIVEQFLHMQHRWGPVDNIVYMGMGEPMQNLDQVIKSIQLLSHPEGLHMSRRRFTISTCGIVAGIERLTKENLGVGLAVSLVTADQQRREQLMPTAKANPISALRHALGQYQARTHQRITLEAALLPGYNNRVEDARAIGQFMQGLTALYNLIPWNPVPNLPFRRPTEQEIKNFAALLQHHGVKVVRRYQRGSNVAAACGQLGGQPNIASTYPKV